MAKSQYEEFQIKKGETLDGKDLREYTKFKIKGLMDPVWLVYEVFKEPELFPWQEQVIRSFYRHKYDNTAKMIRNLYLAIGQRAGKTKVASFIGCIELFNNATLPSPQKFYHVSPGQKLFLTCMATAAQLADDGIFSNMRNSMENNEFLNQWFDFKYRDNPHPRIDYEDKHIHAQVLGSWINTAIGRTNFGVILDEIDYFEESGSKRSGWEVYTRMNKSRDTLGEYGKMIVISSPKTTAGPILTLAKRAIKDSNTFGFENCDSIGMVQPTWELNPRPQFSWKTLSEQYKNDLTTLWRDYGCKPEMAGGVQFPEGVFLDPTIQNVLSADNLYPAEHYPHILSIDPAATNCHFGIAVGYRRPFGETIVDGATYFAKKTGDPFIMPSDVDNFIFGDPDHPTGPNLIARCNVHAFVFDAWMFPHINEKMLKRHGIIAEKHIVNKEDYDWWRSGQSSSDKTQAIRVCYDTELKEETEQLVVTETTKGNVGVNHLHGKFKDMSDAVANVIWRARNFTMLNTVPRCTAIGIA